MHYRKAIIAFLFCFGGGLCACLFRREKNKSIKDLDQHMLDLRIYHENLGDALESRNKNYAEWFVNDMDSILIVMANEFPTHRKLEKSFKYHYKKRLVYYMKNLKDEIEDERWPAALITYSGLTKKCNGCHLDHNIDKEVRDVTKD